MTGLLLSGTGESRDLAECLSQRHIPAIASFAGVTRNPILPAIETRIGGFGGVEGLIKFINNNGIDWIVDATHPFADTMSAHAVLAAEATKTPLLRLERPKWDATPTDRWTHISSPKMLSQHVTKDHIVFLGTGRQTLEDIPPLDATYVYCRIIDPPETEFPWPNGEFLVGRPPFSIEEEIALFKDIGINLIIVKNAGGTGGYAKLAAASKLRVPVILIDRPSLPNCETCQTITDALHWIEARL